MTPMTLDELLMTDRAVITRAEVADLLECDERTVSRAIADGDIPSVRVGRRILIPVRRLIPLLAGDDPTHQFTKTPSPVMSPLVDEARAASALPSPEEMKAIRKHAGVSQERLAEAMGVHRVTLARWESGINLPRGRDRAQYAKILEELSTVGR